LSTFDTNNFVATMHLKDWSKSDSEYAAFDMTGIHGSTYLVSFTRPGYLTRYKRIVLNDNTVDLGNVVLLAGDVNGDGIINASDSTYLQSLYTKECGEDGYDIAADLNGDKIINSADLALLMPNLNKNSNTYNENVNIITVSASLSGSDLNVSGTAKPNSSVIINVSQGGNGIFSENVNVNSSGNYEITFLLSRSGLYEITATSENRVIDATTSINY